MNMNIYFCELWTEQEHRFYEHGRCARRFLRFYSKNTLKKFLRAARDGIFAEMVFIYEHEQGLF